MGDLLLGSVEEQSSKFAKFMRNEEGRVEGADLSYNYFFVVGDHLSNDAHEFIDNLFGRFIHDHLTV